MSHIGSLLRAGGDAVWPMSVNIDEAILAVVGGVA